MPSITCLLTPCKLQIPYDGSLVEVGQELLVTPDGHLRPRRWGVKRIKKVTAFTITAVGPGTVDIQLPARIGSYPQ